jgi:glucosyl-3-phosphoglycerate synthase
MSDFFQTGAITTLHRLGAPRVAELEAELAQFSRERPIALILPCHVRDLGGRGLAAIVQELAQVSCLHRVVVGLDGATRRDEWLAARKFFARLPQAPLLLWNDGPRLQRLLRKLAKHDLDPGPTGKGRNVWLCLGAVLAGDSARVVAVHDGDILTYRRELLARLCYPVAHPSLGFDFCKGYYARVAGRLHGRVTRLLFTPLLRALTSLVGAHPFLSYLDCFRYPLAGEICLEVDLARRLRLPGDWALEVGVLAEVFRNAAPRAICQSELCDDYDHKHQQLSPRDAGKGLHRMAIDIAHTLFRRMAAEGIRLDAGLLDTLPTAYLRQAGETLRSYAADATINGLECPRHEEERAVATFARSLREAAQLFHRRSIPAEPIPSWNQVQSALPDFLEELREAVRLDNR